MCVMGEFPTFPAMSVVKFLNSVYDLVGEFDNTHLRIYNFQGPENLITYYTIIHIINRLIKCTNSCAALGAQEDTCHLPAMKSPKVWPLSREFDLSNHHIIMDVLFEVGGCRCKEYSCNG